MSTTAVDSSVVRDRRLLGAPAARNASRRATRFARATLALAGMVLAFAGASHASAQDLALRAKLVHTMGPQGTIRDGVVLIKDGKIASVGPATSVKVPEGVRTLQGEVLTPGLVDARSTLGLSGLYNTRHDSDQLERSSPMQPELRALDAYNPQERLIPFVRSFGITTVQTGHAPGEVISGQLMVVKLDGLTADRAAIRPVSGVAATVSPSAHKDGARSPGTRGKLVAILRQELIRAQEYQRKLDAYEQKIKAAAAAPAAGAPAAAPDAAAPKPDAPSSGEKSDKSEKPAKAASPPEPPSRDLRLEMLAKVLRRELPLVVTAHRAQDIASVLRLRDEFAIDVVLDGASESYLLIDQLKASGVRVILHASMERAVGENENASFETASKLAGAGIPVAIRSGYEAYVPKARVVLLEAAIAAANGLTFDQALRTITIDAAKIIGVDSRVGSLEVGKDADAALYTGDPFEYTTRCTNVVINGKVVSNTAR